MWTRTTRGDNAHFLYTSKPDSWERIDVAGRNVLALKILYQSRNRDASGPGTSSHVGWYAPEAKRLVRLVSNYVGGPSIEITAWGNVPLEASRAEAMPTRATAPAARRGLVAVEFKGLPEAQLRVDGQSYSVSGSGSVTVLLAPGAYEVRLEKDGYEPTVAGVVVTPGQAKIEQVMPPMKVIASSSASESNHQSAGRGEQEQPVRGKTVASQANQESDRDSPKIAINFPLADSKLETEGITLTGLVNDNVGIVNVHVAVNGKEASAAQPTAPVKAYVLRTPILLAPGVNVIEVTATGAAGNIAQLTRAVTRVIPDSPVRPASEMWAVIVGVGHYESQQVPSLRYSVADADAVYDFLVASGQVKKDHVILLTDKSERKPTLRNLRWALGTFLARSAKRDDTVLIFFAGHGAPEVDQRGVERDGLAKYLIPSDADPDDLFATALPMDDIQTIFGRIEAERVVMFLDACYSGAAGGRTFLTSRTRSSSLDDAFLERLTRSKGRVIVTAARTAEVAVELKELGHGLFTYYLVQGLRGAADTNRDGIVTLQELYEYLEQQVSRRSRSAGANQHPVMKGEMEGALPLAKVRSR